MDIDFSENDSATQKRVGCDVKKAQNIWKRDVQLQTNKARSSLKKSSGCNTFQGTNGTEVQSEMPGFIGFITGVAVSEKLREHGVGGTHF